MLIGFLRSAMAFFTRLTCGIAVFERGIDISVLRQSVFFSNHSSNFDFPAIWSVLPAQQRVVTRPIAALDYWGNGRLRSFLSRRIFNAILIDRNRDQPDVDPLIESKAALRAGESIIIFPEGTRSMDGAIHPFKSGLYRLAVDSPEVEFVPVYIENMNRILPKGEFLVVPLLSRVTFGSPITLRAGEEKESFLMRATSALMELSR
jgi:1-acyl-sn-glycerol-3-phosphate acyltransferase